jgi:uncharacterized membrane protein
MSLSSHRGTSLLVGLLLLLTLLATGPARAAAPIARAVLFYAPTCPHCHIVLDEVLPPLQAQYGDQLMVVTLDVSQPEGQALYQAAIMAFAIPEERLGVPTLVFGDTVLVGSGEIPALLPGMIEASLVAGGNAWPAIPGLVAPAAAPAAPSTLGPFQRDPLANSVAVTLLLVMVATVMAVARTVRAPFARPLAGWRARAVPLLALAGLAIAVYLAAVEFSGVPAVCGPLGDCNVVQQSPYALLFGALPVGGLGALGYTTLLVAWALAQFGAGRHARLASLTLPAIAFGGTLFSIYLTFLEPFVIGASCMWCLSSAALMTALLWVTAPRGPAPMPRGRSRHAEGR